MHYPTVKHHQHAREQYQYQNNRHECANCNCAHDIANHHVVSKQRHGCRCYYHNQSGGHNRTNRTFIRLKNGFACGERTAFLAVVIRKEDTIIDSGTHQDTLHNQVGKIEHLTRYNTAANDIHIYGSHHGENQDGRHNHAAESDGYNQEDREDSQDRNNHHLMAETVLHLAIHHRFANHIGARWEVTFFQTL